MVNNFLSILEMNEFLLLNTDSIRTNYGEGLKVIYNYNDGRNVTSLQKAHES